MSYQGFTIDNILIELINLEMFDNVTLVYLLTANKQLYITSTKKLQSILKKRYLESNLGDIYDFNAYYDSYVKRVLYINKVMKYGHLCIPTHCVRWCAVYLYY